MACKGLRASGPTWSALGPSSPDPSCLGPSYPHDLVPQSECRSRWDWGCVVLS